MPSGCRKKSRKPHASEALAYFLEWADRCGYGDIPAVVALRAKPTAKHIHDAIQWPSSRVSATLEHTYERAPFCSDFP
jgi:hypothetical protein